MQGDVSFFKYGGRPPFWICSVRAWTTHEDHLMVFIVVKNLVGIDLVASIVYIFYILRVWLENACSRPEYGVLRAVTS